MLSGKLNKWRNNFSIPAYKNNKNSNLTGNKYKFTVSTLFSGGLTNTISAIRCEFKCLWGAEYNRDLRNMWSLLTNTVCHKDVFSKSVEGATSPNYLKCNPPSDDYTRNSTGKGGDGDSGWVFIGLPELILKLQPESFLITISDNVYNIHDGVELSSVKQNLKGKYTLFESVLPVWKYGDPTARNWLHEVGTRRKLGQCAYAFRFPKPKFDATLWPRARCIADPDCDVPDECWPDGNIPIAHQGTIKPERPSIHRRL